MPDDLTPVTVPLIPKALAALVRTVARERLSVTDVMNRALIAYDEMTDAPTNAVFRVPREPRRGRR